MTTNLAGIQGSLTVLDFIRIVSHTNFPRLLGKASGPPHSPIYTQTHMQSHTRTSYPPTHTVTRTHTQSHTHTHIRPTHRHTPLSHTKASCSRGGGGHGAPGRGTHTDFSPWQVSSQIVAIYKEGTLSPNPTQPHLLQGPVPPPPCASTEGGA